MGTYTTNKNLFMPSVGETGWGELVNGNFTTIDNFLKPITVSGSTYTFTGNQTGGSVSATSISNSGTSTFTGKITANGGIGTTSLTTSSTITSTGKITGNGGIGTTSLTTSGNITSNGTISAAKIKQTSAMTVTAGTPSVAYNTGMAMAAITCILPISVWKYNGTVKFKCTSGGNATVKYFTEFNTAMQSLALSEGSVVSITLSNASVLYIYPSNSVYLSIGKITLS